MVEGVWWECAVLDQVRSAVGSDGYGEGKVPWPSKSHESTGGYCKERLLDSIGEATNFDQ